MAVARRVEANRAAAREACERRLRASGSRLLDADQGRAMVRRLVDQGVDELLTLLRGEVPAAAEPDDEDAAYRIHPYESLRVSLELFDAMWPALATGELSVEETAAVFSGFHRALVARSATGSLKYIDYLRERIQTAHVDERGRISRDLDDRVVPGVQAAFADFQQYAELRPSDLERASRPLHAAIDRLTDTLHTIREVNSELRLRLAAEPLATAIKNYIRSLDLRQARTWVQVTGDEAWMAPGIRDELYVVTCEALKAMLRTDSAIWLDVRVHVAPDEVRCTLTSAGTEGTEGEYAGRAGDGSLMSLRERLELLGGEITEDALPGGGRMSLAVPLAGAAPGQVA
jgi:signal transduction histidine kinase